MIKRNVPPETAMVYPLLGAWKALATAHATVQTLRGPSHADALANRRAGVIPNAVTCVSATEGAIEALRETF